MRRTAALILGAGIALVGCTSTSKISANNTPAAVQTTAPSSSGAPSATAAPTTPAPTTTSAPVAHVGAVLVLKDTGTTPATYHVALVKVIDPAAGSDQYTTADAGKRFVGVELTVTNIGTAAAQDYPDNDAKLFDGGGQSYSSDVNSIAGCQSFSPPVNFTAGESVTGCVVFQMPTGATPAKFQYSPGSGFSSQFGEWLIP